MNAYRLSFEVRQLLDSIGEGGELTPETEVLLDQLSKDSTRLLEYLGLAIREHNLSSTALRGEAQWLTQGARRHETAGENLRQYLLKTMKALGLEKTVTDTQRIAVCLSPPKVEVDPSVNLGSLPEEFLVRTLGIASDKVKSAAERGETLPEGLSVVRGEHVRISPR